MIYRKLSKILPNPLFLLPSNRPLLLFQWICEGLLILLCHYGVKQYMPRYCNCQIICLVLVAPPREVGKMHVKILPLAYQHHVLQNWVVVSNIFYVHPYLGKISNLTNIFQRGWNHQLEKDVLICCISLHLQVFASFFLGIDLGKEKKQSCPKA